MFITNKNFERSYQKSSDFDVYTEEVVKSWIQSNIEMLEKAELDSLTYDEDLAVKRLRAEMLSLKKINVVSQNQNPFSKSLAYETFYVRPRAVGEEIIKSYDLEKGKAGTVGEIRDWRGGKFQKTAKGWVPVKSGGKNRAASTKDETKLDKKTYEKLKEKFVDEDTGEVVEIERDVQKFSPAEVHKVEVKTGLAKKKFDALNEKRNKALEAREDAYSELEGKKSELRDEKRNLGQIQRDQEELIAQAMEVSEAKGEEEANRIGGEMNEIEDKIKKLKSELPALEKEYEGKQSAFDAADTLKSDAQEVYAKLTNELKGMKENMVKE